MLTSQQLHDYLQRIQYTGSLEPTAETLRQLHIAHVCHIPFENLDIHFGRRISLEITDVFNKLVTRRRGGYCYEMNGLFAAVLETLGFRFTLLMGRIIFGFNGLRPRSHKLMLVEVDGEHWMVDVGHARGLVEPLPLITDVVSDQFKQRFRLREDDFFGYVLQSYFMDQWQDMYGFRLEACHPVDDLFPNYFNSTSPDSIFVQRKMCAIVTPEGRIHLTDAELKFPRNGEIVTQPIESETQFYDALATHFDLHYADLSRNP